MGFLAVIFTIKKPALTQMGSLDRVGAGFRCAEVIARPYVGGHVQAQVNRQLPFRFKWGTGIGISSLYLA
jgi:hypothetical protein